MTNTKYKLDETDTIKAGGKTLYRIVALKKISNIVKEGESGGYIESEKNLSPDGDCWVFHDSMVYENAKITDNAQVMHNAIVFGNATVADNASVGGDKVKIFGNALICDNAGVSSQNGIVELSGDVIIKDKAIIEVESGNPLKLNSKVTISSIF